MTTGDRIDQNSFCYDPDFPPDVAEGLPLVSAVRQSEPSSSAIEPVRRALRACGDAAAALVRRSRD